MLDEQIEEVKQAAARQGGPSAQRGASTAGAGALVTTAKSTCHFREVLDEKTGEIQRFRFDPKRREYLPVSDPLSASSEARNSRYMLQSSSRKLLANARVGKCMRHITGGGEVSILRSVENAKAHYSGLQTCGSVWVCPVCAAKISERRKLELRGVIDTHLAAGGGVEMLTLTFPHVRNDVLKKLLDQLRDALRRFKMHRSYKKARALVPAAQRYSPKVDQDQVIGTIRALETTWGEANGWHPHIHEIWLFRKPLTLAQREELRKVLFSAWSVVCVNAGFPAPNRKRGVHVQPASAAADYVAKWGAEPRWEAASELTKANSKKSKSKKGRTPFDLLRDYAEGDSRAGALFAEYAEAFHGYRQLFWSKGLKALFGIVDLTDEELAAQQEDHAHEITRITKADWKLILGLSYEARGLLLSLAENGGHEAVAVFVDGIRPKPGALDFDIF